MSLTGGSLSSRSATSVPESSYSLSPWTGLLVMVAWALFAPSVAIAVLRRRDV